MKKLKKVIPVIIAFIIGISTTVGATTIFNSKDITYSNDKTEVTNVKDSLDELYSRVGKCPEGKWCYNEPMTLADQVSVGDYISMTPTSTSYTISKDLTGYTTDQTINPSELNLWRVISKNSDGTVDVVSHYVSGDLVYFKGTTGYMNFVGALNTIAAQYTDGKHILRTRHMGYSNQTEKCSGPLQYGNPGDCNSDTGYETDTDLVESVIGNLIAKRPGTTTGFGYWIASRNNYVKTDWYYGVGKISNGGDIGVASLYRMNANGDGGNIESKLAVRPIVTIKADTRIVSGDGQTEGTAYSLG